jgi:hypothetical protein
MHKQETFLRKCKEKYGDKFNYSNTVYYNSQTKISFICNIHGLVSQYPGDHLHKKHGCKQCGIDSMAALQKENSKVLFFKKCLEIHNNKYIYNNSTYVDSHTKISITCPMHGDFMMSPTHHIHMQSGCPVCANYARTLYSKKYFETHSKDVPAYLYIFKLTDKNNIDFLKIGITRTNTKVSRYTHYKSLNGSKLLEIQLPIYEAWDIEQNTLLKFEKFQYAPINKFIGHTECLLLSKLPDIQMYIHGLYSMIPSDSPSSDTITS